MRLNIITHKGVSGVSDFMIKSVVVGVPGPVVGFTECVGLSVAPRDSRRRISGVKFALTFPRCDKSPADALSSLVDYFHLDGLKWAMVVQEDHKEGNSEIGAGKHLHCAVWLNKKVQYRGNKFWNFVGSSPDVECQANILRMARPPGWIKYLLKEKGENYVCTEGFDPILYLKASKSKKSCSSLIVANMIVEGERDLNILIEKYPGFMLRDQKKVQQFISLVDSLNIAKLVPISLSGLDTPDNFNQYEVQIFEWLVYMSEIKHVFPNSSHEHNFHLRIKGPSKVGKSSVVDLLPAFFRCYEIPFDGKWFDDFALKTYDLLVFDEYGKKRSYSPQELNVLSDGRGRMLPQRGKCPVKHSERLPCVMSTNLTWEECYPNVFTEEPVYLAATTRRWKTIEIPDLYGLSTQVKIGPLIDYLKDLIRKSDLDASFKEELLGKDDYHPRDFEDESSENNNYNPQ